MLICIACRPMSCISESAVTYFATLKQKANQMVTQEIIGLPAHLSAVKSLFLFSIDCSGYCMNAIWLSCSDIHMTKCASYNIPGQRKCCCYVLYWAAKSGVQKSCLTICDWWENSLFEALVLNQSSFLVGRWRKRCHLHFLLWLLQKYLNGWENANSIFPCCLKIVWENKYYSLHNFHILGHIMLFARNGWHDLTK